MFLYTVRVVCRGARLVAGTERYRIIAYDTIATTSAEARTKAIDKHRAEVQPEEDREIRSVHVDEHVAASGIRFAGEYSIKLYELEQLEAGSATYRTATQEQRT